MAEDENTGATEGSAHRRYAPLYILTAGLAAIAGFASVALVELWRTEMAVISTPQAGAQSEAGGGMHRLVRLAEPQTLPAFAFSDDEGRERALSEWKGKVVLLNLWATWCAPCKVEMPSLDRLQAKLGGADFAVVPISLDRSGPDKPRAFLASNDLTNLDLFTDSKNTLMQSLRVQGLPLTVILDREGREIARLAGPAEWDSPEAEAVIRGAIARGGS
ncbi:MULTISPECIES: TlpA disulfide reductase family protein [Rhodomicrobium]|uniref:TlpA family protein disulfide reductase n=1 Tax=Rhodomicrobium TaxID=1068 RepID=UPI000B4A989C|nr:MULTISPECIES: TlpA disulfide reductase family protein [Rhodomicrobium]